MKTFWLSFSLIVNEEDESMPSKYYLSHKSKYSY